MDTPPRFLAPLNDVVAALNSRKGDWQLLADLSGVPYSTLAKIAGGFTDNPRYDTVARLHAVLFAASAPAEPRETA